MEQIPTEVKPIINEAFADNGAHSHWELIDPTNGKILWSEESASPCALCEGKDEMIKKLKDNIMILQINCTNYESKANKLNDENIDLHEHNLAFIDQITALQSQCTEKEKECEELKEALENSRHCIVIADKENDELKKQIPPKIGCHDVARYYEEEEPPEPTIEELKAEKESIKKEIERRRRIILIEPNGTVRETMIQNLADNL